MAYYPRSWAIMDFIPRNISKALTKQPTLTQPPTLNSYFSATF